MSKKKIAKPKEIVELEKSGWIPILRTGDFIDSAGEKVSFSQSDLKAICDNYDSATEEAPLVIGHPKHNAPAWGWVKGLQVAGDWLLMQCKGVAQEFQDAVNAGRFNKRSVRLEGHSLKHVGFLGAALPAVSGLGSATLSSGISGRVIELAMESDGIDRSLYWKLKSVGQLLGSLREWIISQNGESGLELADRLLPKYRLEELEQDPPPRLASNYAEEDLLEGEEIMTDLEKTQLAELVAKNAELTAKVAEQAASITTLNAQAEASVLSAWEAERNAFCTELSKQGKILPVDLETVKISLDQARQSGKGEFAAGKNPHLDNVKTFLLSAKPKVALGKNPDGNSESVNQSADSLAKRGTEFQASERAQGREISMSEAVMHVSKTAG